MYQINIYKNNKENTARYLLGSKGASNLVVFGINPSTADENKPDPTIKKVIRHANKNGFDGWIMCNIYPLRATDFDDLTKDLDEKLHKENVTTIVKFLCAEKNIKILAAWGNLITERKYLMLCLKDLVASIKTLQPEWFVISKNVTGHPKHPLYSKEKMFEPFDIDSYLNQFVDKQ